MKALFISNDPKIFEPGSAVAARLAAYAAAIGDLYVVSVGHRSARESHLGALHLYPVFAPRFWRVRALARRARALIKGQGIAIVSAQDPFEHALAALRAVRGTSAKLHIQIHTDFLSPYFARESLRNWMRVRLAGRTLSQAAGIRVVSERIKKSLMARYGAHIKEPVVIPIALDANVPAPLAFPKHFPFTLITASRLTGEKRISDILRALRRAHKRYPGVGLVILGDGPERVNLANEATSLGLNKAVTFLGYRADALALMQSATGYIQASAYEGYGAALIEAALAKLPIITTDVGIVGEVLVPDQDAFVCPVADINCLTTKIETLVADNTLRLRIGHSAEAHARAHLASVGEVAKRIAEDLQIVSTRA